MDEEGTYRDSLATVDEEGKRIWIFPKKPFGKFFTYRKIVSYILLILLFGSPHIRIGGEPMLLFNVIERKFVIFGQVFWPQDFYIFAIALVLGLVFIILFTVIFGRIFCGWICPQTIFMEMVFRRIEYWIEGDWTHQKKLDKAPWNGEKIRKRILKHGIFWIISFLIANTFLAYIIGSEELWAIQTTHPREHIGGLIALVIFTTVFYGVFARLREQVCTTICPYGRLQGVLLDRNSIVITYDHVRGEDRAKFKKDEVRSEQGKGDCIDCNQCVNVCPTGIDIRNGTQLECINCTACIDACDHMMDGVGLDRGLIRYDSENGVTSGKGFTWTRRMIAYSAVLVILLGILVTLIATRTDFDATILRQRGATYQELQDGRISNIYEIDLSNKTKKEYNIELKILEGNGEIEAVVKKMTLKPEQHMRERFLIKMDYDDMRPGKNELYIGVYGNGELISRVRTTFVGPLL